MFSLINIQNNITNFKRRIIMKKKILSVILAVGVFTSTLATGLQTVSAGTPDTEIQVAGVTYSKYATATIDGNLDESNWKLTNSATNVAEGTSPKSSLIFDTAWDDTNFYVAVQVTDNNLINNNQPENLLWKEDTIEIFIDGENNKTSTYDVDDHQIFIRAMDQKIYTVTKSVATELKDSMVVGYKETTDGFTMEVAIPWIGIGVSPKNGNSIGYDIAYDDCNMVGGERETSITWNNKAGDNYAKTSAFGNVFLYKNQIPAVSTEGAPVVDGAIDEAQWNLYKSITAGDNTVIFGSLCDPDYLYIAANVIDANLIDSATDYWDNDGIDIYIDGDNCRTDIDTGNAARKEKQITVSWHEEDAVTNDGIIKKAMKNVAGGYTIEVAIPWSVVGITPKNLSAISFDIANTDNDGDAATKGFGVWAGTGNNWQTTLDYGTLIVDNKNVVKPAYNGVKSTFVDEADDMTKIYEFIPGDNAGNVYVDNTTYMAHYNSSAFKVWTTGAAIVYKTPNDKDMINFEVDTYECGDGLLGIYVSSDNVNYTKLLDGVNYTKSTVVAGSNDNGWNGSFRYTSTSIPDATKHIKLAFLSSDSTNGYKLGIDKVTFEYKDEYSGDRLTVTDSAISIGNVFNYEGVWASNGWAWRFERDFIAPSGDSSPHSVTYESQSGDILNFKLDAIAANYASENPYEIQVSTDGTNFTKANYTKTQTANIDGWIFTYDYAIETMDPGIKYVKIIMNADAGSAGALGIREVVYQCKKVNRNPVAPREINLITEKGKEVTGSIVSTDKDGDTISYALKTSALNGNVTVTSEGAVSYTPNADFVGVDSFEVNSEDGVGGSATTSVNVLVTDQKSNLTYYVDAANGSDLNDGNTEANAFSSIKKAAELAKPGDTVLIKSGTYGQTSGEGVVEITKSGLPDAYITYKAFPGHKPVLTVTNAWNHVLITACYIKIDGITIVGYQNSITEQQALEVYNYMANMTDWATADWQYIGTTNTNGIAIRPDSVETRIKPHHIEITNCEVSKCPGGGIGADKADYITLLNNKVHDNCKWGSYAGSGISIYNSYDTDSYTGYKNIISGNMSYNNVHNIKWYTTKDWSDGNGIIIDDNKNTQSNNIPYNGKTLVTNNIAYNNGGSGIHAYSCNNVDIINNTAYNNNQTPALNWGQIYASSSTYVNVLNNILYAKTGNKLIETYGNKNVVYDYNLYANATLLPSEDAVKGGNSIVSEDPRFKDAANGDFTLLSNSPAIDKATDSVITLVNKDIAGVSRPQGAGVDMGAYELAAKVTPNPGPTPTPTPTLDSIKPVFNESEKTATLVITAKQVQEILKAGRITIDVDKVNGAETYIVTLPSEVFDTPKADILINTVFGKLAIPTDIIDSSSNKGGNISVVITPANKNLTDAQKKVIKTDSIQVSLYIDGKMTSWNNADTAITISIPYKLKVVENPDTLVVLYVAPNGDLTRISTSTYDRTSGMISFKTNHLSVFTVSNENVVLKDMSKHKWAQNQAQALVSKGIMNITDGMFNPTQAITRGEFISALIKASGLSASFDSNFIDVDKTSNYYSEIGIAKKLGVTTGTGNNMFQSDKSITRQDAIVLLNKAMELAGKKLDMVGTDVVERYLDVNSISKYALQSMINAVDAGIIVGSGNKLNPRSNITNSETAIVIYKMLKY